MLVAVVVAIIVAVVLIVAVSDWWDRHPERRPSLPGRIRTPRRQTAAAAADADAGEAPEP